VDLDRDGGPKGIGRVTRLTSDADFDSAGKRLHSMRIPHPLNESAFHAVTIPLAVIRNGEGPTALLVGGVHGDEFEGPVALLNLLRWLQPEDIAGRLIIVPALNPPASEAGVRLSPLDQRDLNRAFPGDPNDSITAVVANYVDTVLLPITHIVLDLHSGGRSMMFLPCLWFSAVADRQLMERTVAAARAFAPPIVLVADELGAGALSASAERHGAVYLSSEVAGGAAVNPSALRIIEMGIMRLLAHFGMLRSAPTESASSSLETRFMHMPATDHYVVAPEAGLLEPLCEIGAAVTRGQPVARMHRLDRPLAEPLELKSYNTGLLVGRRALAVTRPSDIVGVIASDRT
jgi:predicted deacylase